MAIAFDAAATSTDQGASPVTWNHTTGTGSKRFLVVGIAALSTVSLSSVTAVTYNSVAMTKVSESTTSGAANQYALSIWILANPASGTNAISATVTLGTTPHVAGTSVSYTGGQLDNSFASNSYATGSGTDAAAQTVNVTSVDPTDGWTFTIGSNAAAASPTMVATQTSRGTQTLGLATTGMMRVEDSNGAILTTTPSMGFTSGGTGIDKWIILGYTFKSSQRGLNSPSNLGGTVIVGSGQSRNDRAT